jgi:restriction system protein
MTQQRKFYKFMLGARSVNAQQCRAEGFIGTDFDIHEDLTGKFPVSRRDFNDAWVPVLLKPGVSKVAAGLWASQLWVMGYEMSEGDIVICPTGIPGQLYAGEVQGGYSFVPAGPLQHRRSVRWFDTVIEKDELSQPLRASLGYGSTVCTLNDHEEEILSVLNLGGSKPTEDTGFGMEKYLEEFIIENWSATELGKYYDIWSDQTGEIAGQQYVTDNGRIDILAISKDKKELLIVELKRGKASDSVVGQVQRYMGYAVEKLAEPGQSVRGAIIALGDDLSIRRALIVAPNIDFYKYKVDFKLEKS